MKPILKNSRIVALNAFLGSDYVLRAEGLFKNFVNAEIATQPIILDAKETFTKLIIKEYHESFYHASHETVINELRLCIGL